MRRAALLAAALLLGRCGAAAAADEPQDTGLTDSDVVVKTEGPHRLLLPRDWPVEHKDGRIAPVSMETYLSMKFEQVSAALKQLDRRIEALEARLRAAEEAQRSQDVRLKLLEAPQPSQGR